MVLLRLFKKQNFKIFTFLFGLLVTLPTVSVTGQESTDTTAYLLTCGVGTEVYSIYGHSAIRIAIRSKNSDAVYNWGVFDFDTPNFTWKFAKGKLDYMISEESLKSFLSAYYFEHRYVYCQKLNIDSKELRKLTELINENMKPENRKYRYDFFFDNCSTRIRDLLEKAIGEKLKYPPPELGKIPSFRDMVAKYQSPYPWLTFGVDLLLGSPVDRKAVFRDRMFLPIEMREELSKSLVFRSGKMIPLLQNPEVLADFSSPAVKQNFFMAPPFIFTLLIIVILILAALTKSLKIIRVIDIIIYIVFSVLSILLIFFNFFTDHPQLSWNLNIIWLNPFILVCLVMLILNKPGVRWFRIVFWTSAIFLVTQYILPQDFNIAFSMLAIVLLIRSSVRSEFDWNPLSLKKSD